jgi:hypothetical protein
MNAKITFLILTSLTFVSNLYSTFKTLKYWENLIQIIGSESNRILCINSSIYHLVSINIDSNPMPTKYFNPNYSSTNSDKNCRKYI